MKDTEHIHEAKATADQQGVQQTEQQAQRDEHASRMESIRQLAMAGELETTPENEEFVDALLDTIRQRDEMQDKLLRAVADHQNYQRRAAGNEREARTSATQGVVQSLIPLLDTFEMALLQNPDKVSTQQVLDGVKMVRDEFLRMLGNYGVTPINPQVGDEFNPLEHAAMMQHPAEGIQPGHISINMGVGYKLGERVVRPAKVAVVPQPDEERAGNDQGGEN
ncbi:MAG: nucleotide exchange factor GrpE [Phycisphaerales bacterium]